VLGTLVLIFTESRRVEEDERSFIGVLANQCAHALERARVYERQNKIAETLQHAFLPTSLPERAGVLMQTAYLPGAGESEVGGDWYDAFPLPNGRIALSVGDVVGHGLEAAVIMGQLRQTIRAGALTGANPSDVLTMTNHVLRHSHGTGAMATVVYGVLDPIAMRFTYANAGHPAPLVCRPGHEIERLGSGALPLGADAQVVPPLRSVDVPPGALLLLYTDGLIEMTRNVREGEEALTAAVQAECEEPSADAAQSILNRMLRGAAPRDDIAIITLAVPAVPLAEFAITVPADPASIRVVRQTLQRAAPGLNLSAKQAAGLEIAVGEAVNNAIEHAYGAAGGMIHVRARRDGAMLRLEVDDHGQWRPERMEGRGHGLRIMRTFVDEVSVERRVSGTLVTLSVLLPPDPTSSGESPAVRAPLAGDREEDPRSAARSLMMSKEPAEGEAFEIVQTGGIPMVGVSGTIDLSNLPAMRAVVEHAARSDKRFVILSLVNATYLDSQAVHALMRLKSRVAVNRQELILIAPAASLARQILDISGVTSAFRVFETVESALQELEEGFPRTGWPSG